jgi:hypothetical protein
MMNTIILFSWRGRRSDFGSANHVLFLAGKRLSGDQKTASFSDLAFPQNGHAKMQQFRSFGIYGLHQAMTVQAAYSRALKHATFRLRRKPRLEAADHAFA